jgi:hypothetical protein
VVRLWTTGNADGMPQSEESEKQFIFWDVKVCSSVKFTYVSEKSIDFVFMVEE